MTKDGFGHITLKNELLDELKTICQLQGYETVPELLRDLVREKRTQTPILQSQKRTAPTRGDRRKTAQNGVSPCLLHGIVNEGQLAVRGFVPDSALLEAYA